MFSRQLARQIERNKHVRNFSLTQWFKSWKEAAQSQRLVYPPPASQFTTQNRIIDTYITNKQELYTYLSVKPPLLLNFTFATKENNKVTQALFDVLSDKSKYPNNEPVYLVNILADSEGGRVNARLRCGIQNPYHYCFKTSIAKWEICPRFRDFYRTRFN